MGDELKLTREECLICDRVGVSQFYRELRWLGFTREQTLKILKLMAKIYFMDNPLWAGKTRRSIKSGLAYLATQVYDIPCTQLLIAEYFGCTETSVRESYSMIKHHAKFEKTFLPIMES